MNVSVTCRWSYKSSGAAELNGHSPTLTTLNGRSLIGPVKFCLDNGDWLGENVSYLVSSIWLGGRHHIICDITE